jgi:hypothetical protein
MDCACYQRRSRCASAEVEGLEELLSFDCLIHLGVGTQLDAAVLAEVEHAGKQLVVGSVSEIALALVPVPAPAPAPAPVPVPVLVLVLVLVEL